MDFDLGKPMDIQRMTCEVMKFRLAQALSLRELGYLQGIRVETYMDAMADRLVMELKAFLAKGKTEHTSKRTVIEYPSSVWQAFKKRWFNNRAMRWYLRRRPVVNVKIEYYENIQIIRVCPHLPISEDSIHCGHVHFAFLQGKMGY